MTILMDPKRLKRKRVGNIDRILNPPIKPKYRSEYTEADLEEEKLAMQYIRDRLLEQEKKRELEDARRIADEEKEPWPPVWKPIQESELFKSGLIAPFMERDAIEDMDESEFFSDPENRAYGDPDLLNKLKRYFRLVRDTRGYDLDWIPPGDFYTPLIPYDHVHQWMREDRGFKKSVDHMLNCVVDKINYRAKNYGEEYKVLRIEKLVTAMKFRMRLITLSVESGDGVEKDVQALLFVNGGAKYTCLEWRFKPMESPAGSSSMEIMVPLADAKTQTTT